MLLEWPDYKASGRTKPRRLMHNRALDSRQDIGLPMTLNSKITLFSAVLAGALVLVLTLISLYSFRQYSISSATEQVRTAAEIVRVHLTESMIHGVIDKREGFLGPMPSTVRCSRPGGRPSC